MPGKDEQLLIRIKQVMQDNPAYGYERVALELNEGLERVRRIMNRYCQDRRWHRRLAGV